jgi:hypothetical protein
MCANFATMKKKYKKIEVLGEEVMVGFVGIVDFIIKPRLDTTTTTLLPLYVGQVFHYVLLL